MKMTKSALVTGASRGIGRSIAIQLAEEGYNVVVNYAGNKEKADAVVEEIKAKGVESFAIQANVANGDEAVNDALTASPSGTYRSLPPLPRTTA